MAIVAFVLLVGAGAAFALGVLSPSSAPLVPNLTGSTVASATQGLVTAGYTLGSQQTTASGAIGKDLVVSTVPTAGTQLARGQAVALIVSSGPATGTVSGVSTTSQPGGTGGTGSTGGTGTQKITVPDVTGKTRNAAIGALNALGFAVDSVHQSSSTVTSGTVISQDPSGGSSRPKGSPVTITISSGPKQVTITGSGVPRVSVPDLHGLSWGNADAKLTALGLTPAPYAGVSTGDPSLVGIVYGQVQSPGARVFIGSTVRFYYYQGP